MYNILIMKYLNLQYRMLQVPWYIHQILKLFRKQRKLFINLKLKVLKRLKSHPQHNVIYKLYTEIGCYKYTIDLNQNLKAM